MINKTLALTLFGLIAFSGATASAQPAYDPVSIRVSFEGLDIQSEKGAKILLRKIENAAAEICSEQVSSPMDELRRFRPCTQEIVARTVAQVKSPAVQALYSRKAPLTLAQQVPAN